MTEHRHRWMLEFEWTDRDEKLNRSSHYISYRCADSWCFVHKVKLEETTKFEYLVESTFDD